MRKIILSTIIGCFMAFAFAGCTSGEAIEQEAENSKQIDKAREGVAEYNENASDTNKQAEVAE